MGAFFVPVNKLSTISPTVRYSGYISSVGNGASMFITNQYITYADAVTEDDVDYGTGYYLTQEYSNGKTELFGPFNYEDDARQLTNRY